MASVFKQVLKRQKIVDQMVDENSSNGQQSQDEQSDNISQDPPQQEEVESESGEEQIEEVKVTGISFYFAILTLLFISRMKNKS